MVKKQTSVEEKLDDLALMVGRGLEEVREDVRAGSKAAVARFDAVDERLERIEFQVSGEDQRINVIEDRIRQLATKVGLAFN
jgi:hypothetical protein